MGLGLAYPILLSQKAVLRNASPAYKITPRGFLAYLLEQNKPDVLSHTIDDGSGYIRDAVIRAKVRAATGTSVTTDGCTVEAEPAYTSQTMPSLSRRSKGVFFEMSVMQTFERDALASEKLGTGPTKVMTEVMDTIMAHINGLLGDINADLLGSLVFGKNAVTGAITAKTYNFPASTASILYDTGMTELMADSMANEYQLEDANIIGAGLMNKYYLANQRAIGMASNGLNTSQMGLPKFYYDPQFASVFGANHFAVAEKDALQFINVCKFREYAKLDRFGTSTFGTVTFPLADSVQGHAFNGLEFDLQAIEMDCPTSDMTIAGASAGARGRGIKVIITCNFAMVQIPTTAYAAGDPLTGVRGIFRGNATNA